MSDGAIRQMPAVMQSGAHLPRATLPAWRPRSRRRTRRSSSSLGGPMRCAPRLSPPPPARPPGRQETISSERSKKLIGS